jgi:hypothetical protein
MNCHIFVDAANSVVSLPSRFVDPNAGVHEDADARSAFGQDLFFTSKEA